MNEPFQRWLLSGQNALIAGHHLRPKTHPVMQDEPLMMSRGQAQTYVLEDDQQKVWMLKRFHQHHKLDQDYLQQIQRVLPAHPGLRAGNQRQLLTGDDLEPGTDLYNEPDLKNILQGCILMPRIQGHDWGRIADDLREGKRPIPVSARAAMAISLCELVGLLEQTGVSHRDLSSGNVFFQLDQWKAALIDFDSLYGSNIAIPAVTTCGTSGYVAPFLWEGSDISAQRSWTEQADRYALAILCAEILLITKGSPITGEGGMFEQSELCAQSGPGLEFAHLELSRQWSSLGALFAQAIHANSFAQCPSPEQWAETLQREIPDPPLKLKLDDLESLDATDWAELLRRRRPAAPIWPAPRLSELPEPVFDPSLTKSPSPIAVTLPPDPWENETWESATTPSRNGITQD